MICYAKIIIDKKEVFIKAIIDTGNFLREPITKLPVMVVEKNLLYEIIPKNILDNLDKIINGEDVEIGEYISKIRLIPFTSLGKENGILIGIKADRVLIQRDEKNINIDNVIVGIYNGTLAKNGKYQGLIGLDMLEEKEGGINNEYIRNIKI